jgi:hypothetical protein
MAAARGARRRGFRSNLGRIRARSGLHQQKRAEPRVRAPDHPVRFAPTRIVRRSADASGRWGKSAGEDAPAQIAKEASACKPFDSEGPASIPRARQRSLCAPLERKTHMLFTLRRHDKALFLAFTMATLELNRPRNRVKHAKSMRRPRAHELIRSVGSSKPGSRPAAQPPRRRIPMAEACLVSQT